MLLCQTQSCFLVYGPVFYRWPLDRFQHCSHSLVFLLGVLEEVTNRGEQQWGACFSYWVAGNAKKKKKREKEEETRQHTLFESSDRADCKNRRGSPLRDPPAVNTSALCHDKYLFRCSYHAGLLAMSHWSRRQYWIIWLVSQSSVVLLIQQRFLQYSSYVCYPGNKPSLVPKGPVCKMVDCCDSAHQILMPTTRSY